MSTDKKRFPFIREAVPPAGAEGWQRMYPYYLVSQPEGHGLEDSRFWFADSMHWSRAVHPFDSIGAEAVYLGVGQNSTRIFVLPAALGLDVRVVNGFVYICPIPVTDPQQIAERARHFEERAGFYYRNWNALYARWKDKMLAAIARIKALEFKPLGELDPIEVVTEGRGRSTSWDLVENYKTLINEFFVVWQYHFEMLNLGYGAYLGFFQFCKQAFPEIEDQTIARMVSGVEGIAFRPDDELRRLARLAVNLGIAGEFDKGLTPQALFAALGSSAAGRSFVDEYHAVRDPWFNYFSEYGFLHDQETWDSNPAIPLEGIARYIRRLQAGEEIDRQVERLRVERDEIASEYRDLLTEQEAGRFDEMLALSRTVFPYIEEHNIYVEHWSHSAFWKKARELGQALVGCDFLIEADDLFYLNRYELDQVLFDVVDSWAIGVPARGVGHWRGEIEARKAIMAALRGAAAAPAYGIPPDEVTDPFAIMNYGVTTERIQDWLGQAEGGDANFRGIPASPGIVEGVVRVLNSETELGELRAGEILVAPITAPSWASAFSVVAGVVTDIGGMMSHAAIVCREYGVPAVVSTGFGTTRLQTGQRVRIDGSKGTVTVLAEAEAA